MRIVKQHYWTLLIVVSACSARSAALSTVPPLGNPTMSVPSPVATGTATAIPSPMVTLTPTAVKPPALEDIEWTTYEFPGGVSFEYPSDWFVKPDQENAVEFIFSYFPWTISVYVYDRPLKDKAMADPHTWSPDESGYELLWERPISIENAEGLAFIYGESVDDQIGGLLIANYYSEKHALEVRFDSVADMIPTESDKFDIFEHMIQSVRIAP